MPLCVMPGRALNVCAGLLENIVSFAEGGKSVGMFLRNTLANHAQFSDVINVCTGCVCVCGCVVHWESACWSFLDRWWWRETASFFCLCSIPFREPHSGPGVGVACRSSIAREGFFLTALVPCERLLPRSSTPPVWWRPCT